MKKTLYVITLLLINPILTESLDNLLKDASTYNIDHEFKELKHYKS